MKSITFHSVGSGLPVPDTFWQMISNLSAKKPVGKSQNNGQTVVVVVVNNVVVVVVLGAEALLLTFPGVGLVVIDYLNNKITVNTDCDSPLNLVDADFSVSMKIYYDINCVSCNVTTTTTTP